MTELAATTLPAGTYAIDATHSRIGFVVRHAMVTKVRGSFNAFEGSFEITEDVTSSTAKVSIETASVDTRDENRDAHVRSADFFDAENFPTMTYASTGVEWDGEVLRLTGDLTIKGVSKPVTIDFEYTGTAKDPWGNTRVGFEGKAAIDRRDWGITFNSPLENGGLLLSDHVNLEFEVSAVQG